MIAIYKNEWKLFKHDYSRIFTWVTIICVSVFMLIYFTLVTQPDLTMELMKRVGEQIERQAELLGSDNINNSLDLFWFILKNNLMVTGYILLVAFIPLVVLPFLFSFSTTSSIAIVLAAVKVQGESPLKIFTIGVLPHGIVEIIALLLASSIGIYLSKQLFKKIFSKKRSEIRLLSVIWQAVRSFLLVVAPLITIAALIEGFITPTIMKMFI